MKSNTPIIFVPILIMFVMLVLLHTQTSIIGNMKTMLFFIMFGYLFIGTAIAQKRSGYFWKNLRNGNRGKHKSESPKMFVVSNIFHTCLGLAIWTFAIVRFFLGT